MSDFDDENLPDLDDNDNDDEEEGPDSINDIYGYDDPEDNDEAAFDDVLKAMERGE